MAKDKCGNHNVARYLARVNGMKRQFSRLADGELSEAARLRSR